jgi:hypothetical protein
MPRARDGSVAREMKKGRRVWPLSLDVPEV